MSTNQKHEAEVLTGPAKIERLERMEGLSGKIMAGVIILVVAVTLGFAVFG